MNIILKKIGWSEREVVFKLFKEAAEKIARKNINHWQHWHNPSDEDIAWAEEGIINEEFFFIEAMGEIIGMVRILEADELYWGKSAVEALYIHSLVVVEKYEGRGIGGLILQKIAANAKLIGKKYMRLDASTDNPKLCKYYENLGFILTGTTTISSSSFNLYQKAIES